MKRLVIAALALVAVGVVASSALAATGTKASVIFDSTSPNGPPPNLPSYGPAAYYFNSIGDKINFTGTARNLTNATVTMSSWACQQGTWQNQTCVTTPGATFSQPITLSIYNVAADGSLGSRITSATQTFNVPYRPSASPKCLATDPNRPGGWYQPSPKTCKNGLTDDVTFNFSGVTLPSQVVYAISYPTGSEPSNSLNVAVTDQTPSAGGLADLPGSGMWIDGAPNASFDNGNAVGYAPSVQFKAGNAS